MSSESSKGSTPCQDKDAPLCQDWNTDQPFLAAGTGRADEQVISLVREDWNCGRADIATDRLTAAHRVT